MPEFTLVDDPASLESTLQELAIVAVDTEFMREKTFFSQLCLVQLAAADHIYCVDPLDRELSSFWDSALTVPWVLHSGRQDIEVVYQAAGRMPVSVFDTQVAAGLLGYPAQMGYATLVNELFGVEIDKSHTRADWSRRPLPEAYLHYAAEDVEYLLPAYEMLAERLETQSRLAWAEEDSALLLDPALYDIDPATAIDRLKGARNLRGKRRAAAVRLAEWRETEALRANRPRQWIARDAVLIDLAARLPQHLGDLENVDGLSAGLVRRSGRKILAAIATSLEDGNHYAPPRAPNEAQKSLLKSMQQKVATCAAELGIAAETVASKRDLSAVVLGGDRDSRVLSGWRRELIGEELLALL